MVDIEGHLAPLVTPFTDDSSGLSEIRLARLIRMLVEHDARGFVVCADVAEFTCLSFSERKTILEVAIRECQGALPVLVNVSTLSTSYSLDLAQHAQRHGARAVVLMPPYYSKLTDEEIAGHYHMVCQYADLPVIAVDPFRVISEAVQLSLADVNRLQFAESGSRTDWFDGESFRVRPSYGVPIMRSEVADDRLNDFALQYGSPKAIKAALESLDIEVGPVRKPLIGLSREECAEIAGLTTGS